MYSTYAASAGRASVDAVSVDAAEPCLTTVVGSIGSASAMMTGISESGTVVRVDSETTRTDGRASSSMKPSRPAGC